MHECYVCGKDVNIEIDMHCTKTFDDGIKYRRFWHGVPGVTRTAPSAGIQGYAMTIADAKKRAEYYINENPYAAPEVKADELEILEEIQRMERVSSIIGFMERNVIVEQAKDDRAASIINVDYLHQYVYDGAGDNRKKN